MRERAELALSPERGHHVRRRRHSGWSRLRHRIRRLRVREIVIVTAVLACALLAGLFVVVPPPG
jgi:hypothetical protein